MKKFLLSVMMFVMAGTMNMFGQSQEYIDAFNEFYKLNPSAIHQFNKEQMKPNLISILQNSDIVVENQEATVNKYLDTQLTNDIKEIIINIYYNNITLDELKSIVNAYKNPDLTSAWEKTTLASKSMQEEIQTYLMGSMVNIMSGKDVDPAELNPNISTEYFNLVKEYTAVTKAASLVESAKIGLIASISNQIEDENSKKMFENIMNKGFSITINNIDRFTANAFIGTVTKKDIKIINEFATSDAGKAQIKVTAAMTEDIVSLGMKIINKFSNWAKSNSNKCL